MSYRDKQLLREFVRESLREALKGPEAAKANLVGDYDTSFGPQDDIKSSRGYDEVQFDGSVMSFVLRTMGMPQSSMNLYNNFFGPRGFFDFGGIFGNRASPFGRDINAVGNRGLGTVSAVLGPRNASSMGQNYWTNLKRALSGDLPMREAPERISLLSLLGDEIRQQIASSPRPEAPAAEPEKKELEKKDKSQEPDVQQKERPTPAVASEVDDQRVLDAVARDTEKIIADFEKIKDSETVDETVLAWQSATGFGEDPATLLQVRKSLQGKEESARFDKKLQGFIKNDLSKAYYADMITPVIDAFLSPGSPVSPAVAAKAVSALEDTLSKIK